MTNTFFHRPRILACATAADAARTAAELILSYVAKERHPVLGLATGRTPLAVYVLLADAVSAGRVSFAAATTFNLDEYRGLPETHPASFHAYMQRQVFDHLDLGRDRCHLPDGNADPEVAGAAYEAAIAAAGGIGLQLLGIGQNGHIGFNEPGSAFDSRTREVVLSETTRRVNSADFPEGEAVPRTAISMGIGSILEARSLLLLATGSAKAEAVARALRQPPDPDRPASALQLHPRATVVLDRDAAAGLARDG